MKTNLGSYDVAVRFVLGCAIGFWGIERETWWGLVGLVPMLTALLAFCPLYMPFHIDTTFTDESHT